MSNDLADRLAKLANRIRDGETVDWDNDLNMLWDAIYEIRYIQAAIDGIGSMAWTLKIKNDTGYGITSRDVESIYNVTQEALGKGETSD